jgi:hypothetical protein
MFTQAIYGYISLELENHNFYLSGSYSSWIYNYLCNQWLSPLTLLVRTPIRQGVLDTTLCDKVCQWLSGGQWFSLGTPVSSTNKTDCHDRTEILLKVALKATTLTPSVKFAKQNFSKRILIEINFIY